MKKNLFRVFAATLALLMLVPCFAMAEDTKLQKNTVWQYGYNDLKETGDKFVGSLAVGCSYIGGSRLKTITGDDAIKVTSLGINRCDFRWWSMANKENKMVFSLDFKLTDPYTTDYLFCVNTQDGSTTTESTGGMMFEIKSDNDGNAFLAGWDGKKIADLDKSKVYSIELTLTLNSAQYEIKLDGEVVANPVFKSAVNTIAGLRMNAYTKEKESMIIIDNFKFITYSRQYPQHNSFQEKGTMPTVELPGTSIPSSLTLFCNKTDMGMAPTQKDGTYYVPFEKVLEGLGKTYEKNEKGIIYKDGADKDVIVNADTSFTATVDGTETQYAGEFYAAEDGTLMASLKAVNILLESKIWLDEASNVLMISSKDYLDNVMRVIGGKLWMNGEPYYEFSFNKFDLVYQISGDDQYNNGKFTSHDYPNDTYTHAAAEEALKQLAENGFRTIRMFCGSLNPDRDKKEVDNYWKVYDDVFDLLDKYGIQAVVCMQIYTEGLFSGKYEDGFWVADEDSFDFATNSESKSRGIMRNFLKEFINRYKDRKTILMYEFGNEGNLNADLPGILTGYSAIQLGELYADFAETIHKYDPDRPVTSGDAALRPSQYNQLKGVMKGQSSTNWTVDNKEERRQILQIINYGLDVISVHAYNTGYGDMYMDTEKKRSAFVTFPLFMEEADALGKPLYIGECDGQVAKKVYGNADPKVVEGRTKYIDTIIDAGVQLTHWWTFHSDRATFNKDLDNFSITIDQTPECFEMIKNANAKLKETYVVNALADCNAVEYQADVLGTENWEGKAVKKVQTVLLTVSGQEVLDKNTEDPGADNAGISVWVWVGIAAAAAVIAAVCVIFLGKKKKA